MGKRHRKRVRVEALDAALQRRFKQIDAKDAELARLRARVEELEEGLVCGACGALDGSDPVICHDPEQAPGEEAKDERIRTLAETMSTDPRDWSVLSNDAWLYGVVVGWGDALAEVAERHRWTLGTCERLMHLNSDNALASPEGTGGAQGK